MADSKREIERKYEATAATRLPDLSRVAGVVAVAHRGVTELDAVYYDTEDLRLAAASLTLRRRTGGSDMRLAPQVPGRLRHPGRAARTPLRGPAPLLRGAAALPGP